MTGAERKRSITNVPTFNSENYNKSKVRVTVVVKTGIGGFRLTWI